LRRKTTQCQRGGTIQSNESIVLPVQADLGTYEGVEKFHNELKSAGRPWNCCTECRLGVGGDFTRETDLEQELESSM